MAVKGRFEGKPWIEWAEDIRLRWQPAMDYYRRELYFEVEYNKYLQFKFDEQWRKLKAYANSKGIQIIGDIPIYVALDSADAWANPGLFQLDKDNIPAAVAGVPPDGFSPTGQLWGNPLYCWETHRATGYQWWITRLWYCFELYDVVRMHLAAACTSGKLLPNMERMEPFNVIYQTAEDGLGDTVKPRLIEAGADLDRVLVIDDSDVQLTLSDERIEKAIIENNARLVIIDPIQAYLGADVDMNRANEVRPIFMRLGQVAQRTGCAILLIGHLNKAAGMQSLQRGLGSIDIAAAVRSVMFIGKLKHDPTMRMLKKKLRSTYLLKWRLPTRWKKRISEKKRLKQRKKWISCKTTCLSAEKRFKTRRRLKLIDLISLRKSIHCF